jgi:tRNA(Leu) C34 or U34 (ribose-2'-O)-methylase TrmL
MEHFPRGFAAIGLHRPKDPANVGGVLRAAMCYRAASVAISGERIDARHIRNATNTIAAQRHIPILRGELRDLIPYGAIPVAVELVEDAEPLPSFVHPASAFYVFGPEDGTLGKAILDWCPKRVMVPTRLCMNLAATVNVVLYDRLAKRAAPKDRPPLLPESKFQNETQAPGL